MLADEYMFRAILILPDPRWRRSGQSAGGLLQDRSPWARVPSWRSWCLCGVTTSGPRADMPVLARCRSAVFGCSLRHRVRRAEPRGDARPLPHRGDTGGAVSSGTGPSCCIKWFSMIRPPGNVRFPTWRCRQAGFPSPLEKYLFCLTVLVVLSLAAKEHHPRHHRPPMDGNPRHGRGGGGDRHPPDVRQAVRLRRPAHFMSASPARLWASCIWAPGNRRRSRSITPSIAVHGDHQRPGARSWAAFPVQRSSSSCRSSSTQFLPVLGACSA